MTNKIQKIETFVAKIPLKRTFVTAVRSTNHIDSVVVKLTLDNGVVGFGAAPATTAITGDTIDSMTYIIKELFSPVICNTSLDDYKSVMQIAFARVMFNTGAKMAIDLAYHDLLAKTANVSVAKLLNARSNVLETDVSISCGDVVSTVDNISNGIEAGFNSIKVKTGADFDRDIELLKALDTEFATDIKFRFDANQGWSVYQARQFIEELSKYNVNVELVEQPVKYYDIKGMSEITQFSNIPILADESVFSAADAIRLIDERACNMLNIKLAKTGGILEAQKIKQVADDANIPCMIGCMMESPLGIAAATVFALSENISMADLDVLDWVKQDVYSSYIDFNQPNIVLKDDIKGFGFKC